MIKGSNLFDESSKVNIFKSHPKWQPSSTETCPDHKLFLTGKSTLSS